MNKKNALFAVLKKFIRKVKEMVNSVTVAVIVITTLFSKMKV
jgi:hypothetical protein